MTQQETRRKFIMCDCCGKEVLGEVVNGKLVIKKRSNRQTHFRVLNLTNPAIYGNNKTIKQS